MATAVEKFLLLGCVLQVIVCLPPIANAAAAGVVAAAAFALNHYVLMLFVGFVMVADYYICPPRPPCNGGCLNCCSRKKRSAAIQKCFKAYEEELNSPYDQNKPLGYWVYSAILMTLVGYWMSESMSVVPLLTALILYLSYLLVIAIVYPAEKFTHNKEAVMEKWLHLSSAIYS